MIKDKLEWILNERAIKYGNGIHPKHYLVTKYHQFFIDRIQNGETVVDIGCGLGAVAIDVASVYKKCLVIGIDINEDNIKKARELKKDNYLENLVLNAMILITIKLY